MEGKGVYATIFVLVIFIIAGFFLVFDTVSDMRGELRNVETALELLKRGGSAESIQEGVPQEEEKETVVEEETSLEISIPTAIILETSSSPALLPIVPLTVTVESVVKAEDGIVAVNFKVYTDNALGYTALNPNDIFSVIFPDGSEQNPIKVNGMFESMPQKSMIPGNVLFRISADDTRMLLQIGKGEHARFYDFDFKNKTYKETVIG